jgi:superfamily II DNA helicase RecQ
MVENETLKKEVNELIHAFSNAYDRDARLLKYLGSQRFSLNKEGLGYTPKKGKAAFVTPKARFVKGNGRFCNRRKQIEHIEQYCKTNKNKQPNISSIRFDSCYMLVKGANGVKAKFIGTPIVGPKKKAIRYQRP